MGFFTNGKHSHVQAEGGWFSIKDNPPKDYESVYLLCRIMMDEFVVIGQIAGDQRVESDADPDVFLRSAIISWKPLYGSVNLTKTNFFENKKFIKEELNIVKSNKIYFLSVQDGKVHNISDVEHQWITDNFVQIGKTMASGQFEVKEEANLWTLKELIEYYKLED